MILELAAKLGRTFTWEEIRDEFPRASFLSRYREEGESIPELLGNYRDVAGIILESIMSESEDARREPQTGQYFHSFPL